MGSHHQRVGCLRAMCLTFLLWCFPSPVRAATYTFTLIADTTGPFKTLGLPALTTQGRVAFFASLDTGGQGIFRKDGERLTTIADDQGAFQRFSDSAIGVTIPSINAQGTVAFWAVLKAAGQGIFSGRGQQPTTIADDRGVLQTLGLFPSLNDSDTVAFWATTDAGGSGVFTGRGGPLTTVADTDELFAGFGVPAINNPGWVTFVAERVDPPLFGIVARRRDVTRTIIDKFGNPPLPLQGFRPPRINTEGTVVFAADLQSQALVLFTGDGEKLQVIAENERADPVQFISFGTPAINNQGNIAFSALVSDARVPETYTGVFTGPEPLSDQVIRSGAALMGSTLTSAQMFREGLNDEGQIAFHATRADGTEAIYRADLTSEVVKSPLTDR
jgi:hypothetical protein